MENEYSPIINYPSDADVQQAYRDGYTQGLKNAYTMPRTVALAMLAGARAIETNRRCNCATYVRDPFGEKGGPEELTYYTAARILREEGEMILESVKE